MAENLRKVRNCTYLFTTATITVFSEEFTALIDLNVNRGSLLASQQTSGKKPWHQINDFFFFFLSFTRCDSPRQAESSGGALRAALDL